MAMLRNVTLERRIEAPQSAVWAVLADYPNIAAWNSGVKKSHATSEATEGVGAERHCDLAPFGQLEEVIEEWEPESRLVIAIDASRIPINQARMTFTLGPAGDATDYRMSYDFQPAGGPLRRLIGPLLERQLRSGFEGFIDDLERAAGARPAA